MDPQYLDPDSNPFAILFPSSSTFGGKDDYTSGQDDGKLMGGAQGMSYDPEKDWENPEPYLALNPKLAKSLNIQPGQQVPVINPHNGQTALGIYRDSGPSEQYQHRLDMSKTLAASLGLKPGQSVAIDFKPIIQGKMPVIPPGGGQGQPALPQAPQQDNTQGMMDATNSAFPGQSMMAEGQPPSSEDIQQALATQPPDATVAGNVTPGSMNAALSALPVGQGVPAPVNPALSLAPQASVDPEKYKISNIDPKTGIATFADGTTFHPTTGTLSTPMEDGGRAVWFPGANTPHYIKPGANYQIIQDTNTGQHFRVNKETGEASQIKLPQVDTGVPEGVTGEEALKNQSPQDAAIAKKIANYDIPLPSGFALRSAYWQRIMGLASAYDPSFDASNYSIKMAARKAFTSGKYSQSRTSLNQAVQHLSELQDAANALNNSNWQPYNTIANYLIAQKGDPRITKFNGAATAVQNELATVFKGTGATDQEIHQWRNNLSSSQSPAQLNESIDEALRLMNGRVQSLQDAYTTAVGKPADFSMLGTKAKQILETKFGETGKMLTGQDNPSENGSMAPKDSTGPQTVTNKAGKQIIVGHPYTDANGNTKTFQGGDPDDPNNYK